MTDRSPSPGSADGAALFAGVLENMSSGVITLDLQGRILTFNAAAAELLGVPRETALGETFASVFFLEAGFDAFNEAVLDAIRQSERAHRQSVSIVRDGIDRRLDLTTTLQQEQRGDRLERVGVIAVFDDITEMARLRETERANHTQLQTAFLELEQKTERIDALGRKIRYAQIGAGLLVVVAVMALAYVSGAFTLSSGGVVQAPQVTAGGTTTITRRAISSSISVVGTLKPGANVNVVGPFDGLVREMKFTYGSTVERDSVVVVMDTRDLEVRAREARAAYIKAEEQIAELQGWRTGAEVARATRSLALARQQMEDLRRRAAETKRLLDQGIVPQEEHRSALQQLAQQELQLLSSQQDLDATMKRGDQNKLGIAQLELQNARARMEELDEQLQRAVVKAPVSGVALIPLTTTDSGRPQMVERGARVTQGQTMFSIGDLETLAVQAKVDEVDIGKVKVGQRAVVAGDAFAGFSLPATVAEVSSQASSSPTDRGLPSFDVLVVIRELTPEQRAKIRVGMSANLAISTYDNPQAIVVPATAIGTGSEGPIVWTVGKDGKAHETPVQTGSTTIDGVEVVGGLAEGDMILTDANAGGA